MHLPPKKVQTISAATVGAAGLILALSSISPGVKLDKCFGKKCSKYRNAFGALLGLGIILLIVAFVLTQLPLKIFGNVSENLDDPASPAVSATPSVKSILKKPGTVALAEVGQSSAGSHGVQWQPKLEEIVEFRDPEAPINIHIAKPTYAVAHDPKPVPARPRVMAQLPLPLEASAAAPAVPVVGYASAYQPRTDEDVLASNFAAVQVPPAYVQPLYSPPSKYPTVSELAEERAVFSQRADTPELDRHRRVGQLREASLTMPMAAQHDGLIVPIGKFDSFVDQK